MCIADPQPSVRPRRLRRPPRAGQGWAGGRVSSGRRRRCLAALASPGADRRPESASEPRAAGSSEGREGARERPGGRGGKKCREGRRARAPQPGRGRGRAPRAVRQRLCAPRTPVRPLTSAEPRAGPGDREGRGRAAGGSGERGARPGPRQPAGARARRVLPPRFQPPRAPRTPVASRGARGSPGGRVRARAGAGPGLGARRVPSPPRPAPRSGGAGPGVNGSAGGPPGRLSPSPASSPSWLRRLAFAVAPRQPRPGDLSQREGLWVGGSPRAREFALGARGQRRSSGFRRPAGIAGARSVAARREAHSRRRQSQACPLVPASRPPRCGCRGQPRPGELGEGSAGLASE